MEEIDILKHSLEKAPIIWKGDYPYFIHPITDGVPRLEPNVLEAIIELSVPLINWDNIDVILGIEAMGLPLMAPLSMRTNIPMVIARKRQYGLEGDTILTLDKIQYAIDVAAYAEYALFVGLILCLYSFEQDFIERSNSSKE